MSGLVLSGSEHNVLLSKDESFRSLQDYQQQVQSEVETRAMLAKVLSMGSFLPNLHFRHTRQNCKRGMGGRNFARQAPQTPQIRRFP